MLVTLSRPNTSTLMGDSADVPAAELSAAKKVQLDQNRADFMEFLYELDGRDDPSHPYAKTYTGLHEAFALEIGFLTLKDIAADWHNYQINDRGALVGGNPFS